AHRLLHSFPTRRSSDLSPENDCRWVAGRPRFALKGRNSLAQGTALGEPTTRRFRPERAQHRALLCPFRALRKRRFIAPRVLPWRSEEHTSELQSRVDLV